MTDDEGPQPPARALSPAKDFPGMAPWVSKPRLDPAPDPEPATEPVAEEPVTSFAAEPAARPAASAESMMSSLTQPHRRRGRARTWTAALTIAAVIIAVLALGLYFYISATRPGPTTVAVVTTPSTTPSQQAAPPSGPSQPAVPVKIQTQTFGDWIVGCPADQSGPCTAQQRLVSSGGQAALVWSLQRDPKGGLHSLWLLPTGLVLARGMTLDVGDGKPSAIPFASCDTRGCFARAAIAPDYLAKLEAAATLTASVTIESTGKPFAFTLSSHGLSDAVSNLTPAK